MLITQDTRVFTSVVTDIKMDGTQSAGTLATFPRSDHVHPSDTSRALLAGSAAQTFSVSNLQFPATQVPSADPNNLDDYEEGTFTPIFELATPGTSSFGTYTVQQGSYVKIGKLVTLHIVISSGTFSLGTGSGNITIKGLPTFTPSTGNDLYAGAAGYSIGFVTLYPNICMLQTSLYNIGLWSAPNTRITSTHCASSMLLYCSVSFMVA